MFDVSHFLKTSAVILELNVITPLAREVSIMEVFLASQTEETSAVKILRQNYALALDSLQQLRIVASNYRQASFAASHKYTKHVPGYHEVMEALEKNKRANIGRFDGIRQEVDSGYSQNTGQVDINEINKRRQEFETLRDNDES